MKIVFLTNGKSVKIDDEDFDYLNQWKWNDNGYGYAQSTSRIEGKRQFMHRLLNQTPTNYETDHINGDRLDNRKKNLRTVTRSLNQQNRTKLNKNNSSGVTGVWWDKRKARWTAEIWRNSKKVLLGRFELKEEAIKVRMGYL